jgi:hypothetical protein
MSQEAAKEQVEDAAARELAEEGDEEAMEAAEELEDRADD